MHEDREAGQFNLYIAEEMIGYLSYRLHGHELWLLETTISRPHRLENPVPYLLTYALDSARARKLSVIPQSPAVRGFMAINPLYGALVPEGLRHQYLVPPGADNE